MSDHRVLVVPRSHDSFLAGLKLYRKRPDKEYSLTDCISMYTMRLYGLNEALTRGSSAAQIDLFLASGEPVYRRDGGLCILGAERAEMAGLAVKHRAALYRCRRGTMPGPNSRT